MFSTFSHYPSMLSFFSSAFIKVKSLPSTDTAHAPHKRVAQGHAHHGPPFHHSSDSPIPSFPRPQCTSRRFDRIVQNGNPNLGEAIGVKSGGMGSWRKMNPDTPAPKNPKDTGPAFQFFWLKVAVIATNHQECSANNHLLQLPFQQTCWTRSDKYRNYSATERELQIINPDQTKMLVKCIWYFVGSFAPWYQTGEQFGICRMAWALWPLHTLALTNADSIWVRMFDSCHDLQILSLMSASSSTSRHSSPGSSCAAAWDGDTSLNSYPLALLHFPQMHWEIPPGFTWSWLAAAKMDVCKFHFPLLPKGRLSTIFS